MIRKTRHPQEAVKLYRKFQALDVSALGFGLMRLPYLNDDRKQLDKCQVDFFGFYLMHSVSDNNITFYIDDELGLTEYLLKEKRQGVFDILDFRHTPATKTFVFF